MNQEEREKRFDEKIGQHLKIVIKDYSQEICNDILAFIQSEIDLALANRNKEIVEKMVSIVTGHHCVARKSYHKDSWDAGYHDALFAIEKSLINLITKDNE